ncbi:G_PROTEIN_RECEP_F1_2 domain-containing protein [Meloidogyne graminicola]|uniref:G_PROTEIN_RECEP_F1_2 domain-containing protein n=1 Tax=Meloidogyne graminicola TaxID=189291 RepID=A0A8S9ZN78_9BILA|nr:G_PROTEIN_RECEP_F1_2 domain-containing protein [Meloidogyne graminicola]
MQSRANTFLAMLAFADIFFLSLVVPNILANYSIFSRNWHFRMCVIAVCTDRLIGIRNPLAARGHITRRNMVAIICAIVLVPGLLTAHQHVAHVCLVRAFCNGSQLYSKCLPVNQERWFAPNQSNPYSESFRKFIYNISNNCPRIFKHNAFMCVKATQSSSHSSEGLSQHLLHAKTEQRVTITVALALVIFGKASNFILFCLFSKHFRRRLFSLAQKRLHKRLASVGTSTKGCVGGTNRSNYNKFRGDSSNTMR